MCIHHTYADWRPASKTEICLSRLLKSNERSRRREGTNESRWMDKMLIMLSDLRRKRPLVRKVRNTTPYCNAESSPHETVVRAEVDFPADAHCVV